VKGLTLIIMAAMLAGTAFAVTPPALTAGGVPGGGAQSDAIGSSIRSFRMTGLVAPYALGIYRDPSYVYGIGYTGSSTAYLLRFTSTGSSTGSFAITGVGQPRDADRAHLGAGYLSFVDANTLRCYIFRTSGGAAVSSFPCSGSPYPLNVFWDGSYYCVNGSSNRGLFYRYTTSGSSDGTWSCAGWPAGITVAGGAALANAGNNTTGTPYFVACSWSAGEPMLMTTYPGGSLVRTWSMPNSNGNGICYGDSSNPSTYGASIWANWYTGSGLYAFEIDINARNASNVTPASLGKVKSLYR
jgi:hypothetical protein